MIKFSADGANRWAPALAGGEANPHGALSSASRKIAPLRRTLRKASERGSGSLMRCKEIRTPNQVVRTRLAHVGETKSMETTS
jgi:hypothetical protein